LNEKFSRIDDCLFVGIRLSFSLKECHWTNLFKQAIDLDKENIHQVNKLMLFVNTFCGIVTSTPWK